MKKGRPLIGLSRALDGGLLPPERTPNNIAASPSPTPPSCQASGSPKSCALPSFPPTGGARAAMTAREPSRAAGAVGDAVGGHLASRHCAMGHGPRTDFLRTGNDDHDTHPIVAFRLAGPAAPSLCAGRAVGLYLGLTGPAAVAAGRAHQAYRRAGGTPRQARAVDDIGAGAGGPATWPCTSTAPLPTSSLSWRYALSEKADSTGSAGARLRGRH